MESIDLLDNYIAQEINKSFLWGDTDCCTTADKWVFLRTGKSPLSENKSLVIDEKNAKRMLRSKNMLKIAADVLKDYQQTKTPKTGDIGIIVLDKRTIAFAIKTKDGWFTRNEKGCHFFNEGDFVARAWNIE